MDELPPIRNLSLTQQRIRDALKNAPPLTITNKEDNQYIVFEDKSKTNENSLFNRFLKHKSMAKNSETDGKKTGYKWSQLKDKMEEELETKRMESQKFKEINDKLENEELEEFKHSNEDIIDDNIEENKSDSELRQNESSDVSDEEKEEEEEEEDDDEDIESEVEDENVESEDEKSDRESNPFIDDEADEEEDIIFKNVDNNSNIHSDESNENCEVNGQQKKDLNDSVLDTSYNPFDESFERKCATQKIALSPFITQKPKPRFNSKNNFSELISDFHTNAEEFNSQSLLDLCSGNFTDNVNNISSQLETEENQTNGSNELCHDSEEEEGDEDKEVSNRRNKVFNIESDNESESDDNRENDLKTTEEIKTSLKNFNESDGEELIVTDDDDDQEEEEDEEEEEEEEADTEEQNQNESHNVNAFFDDEAELSGSDEVSSDEEDVDDEELEEDEEKEELPSDSEIEDQNMRYFNKQTLDEEKRNLIILKERLLEDGDLHDGRQREKKFRWNFETNDDFVNDYINEDSDDNYMDSDEDEKTKTPTLKMCDQNSNMEIKITHNLEKFKTNLKKSFDLKNINKNIGCEPKKSSISTFVVRDERLKTIMSFESKRSLNSKNKSNKKMKTSKKSTKTSIFDLF